MPDPNIRIGPYRLFRVLGKGGMGVVYQAEQLEPVKREVAVKLVHAGFEGSDVLVRRFESERQALAVMEHPSIARVYDGGVTDDGRSYFVMELVRGIPLLEYCDNHNLALAGRIALFSQVCRAVQHAHQKGVIHRDLKPSNILVTESDGQPLAKVIDFGIARAVAPGHEAERLTVVGEVIGTPAYMSPEQLTPGMDVDTRSDVYALGVVLYELFTGHLPFEQSAYQNLAMFGATPMDPPRPGQRISRLGNAAKELAARRGADPIALVRALRGDLDWIVMKAMDPERERRYDTANGLALDLERSLADEPVLARPPSRAYRARKFVRRHTVGVASGLVIALVLVGSVISQTIQAGIVARARDEAVVRRTQAEGLIDFMLGDLWNKLQPVGRLEILNDIGARAVAYFDRIDPALMSDEEVAHRSRMLYNIGDVRMKQGNSVAATEAFEQSLRLVRELAARKATDTDVLFNLGQSEFWVGSGYYRQARYADAQRHFQAYRDISRDLASHDSSRMEWIKELGYSHTNVGAVELALGNNTRAAEEFRAALEVKTRVLANKPDDRGVRYDVARAHYNLAEALIPAGDLSGAIQAVDQDIAIKRALLALDAANAVWRNTLVNSLTTRATANNMLGHTDAALTALTEAASILEKLGKADKTNRDVGRSRANNAVRRADVLMARPDSRATRLLLAPATQALEQLVAEDTARLELRQDLAYARRVNASVEMRDGRVEVARAFAAAGGALLPASAPDATPRLMLLHGASARLTEGSALARLGDTVLAKRRWEDAERLAAARYAGGDDPVALAIGVEALIRLERHKEADALLVRLRTTGYRETSFVQRMQELGVRF